MTPLELELFNALKAVMPILEAVRFQINFGKRQEERIKLARDAIEHAKSKSPSEVA